MKKYIPLCMLGIVAMLASCSQNEELSALTTNNGDLQSVTITLAPDAGMQTRAGSTVTIDRYVMEVYNSDGTPANVFDNASTNHKEQPTAAFTMVLDRSKTYHCIFWADNGAADIYDVASLKAVTLKADQEAIQGSYYGTQAVSGGTPGYTVTLKRAVAKIRFGEKDKIAAGSALAVAYTPNASFNVLDGTVTAAGSEATRSISFGQGVNATPTAPEELTSFYMLAPVGESNVQDFKFTLNSEAQRTVTNVPVRANHATYILGEFSSLTSKSFTTTIDETWLGNEELYPLSRLDLGSNWTETDFVAAMLGDFIAMKSDADESDLSNLATYFRKYGIKHADFSEMKLTKNTTSAYFQGANLETIKWTRTPLPGESVVPIQLFYNCTTLREIDLMGTVGSIDNNAFLNCSALTKVTGTENIDYLASDIFSRTPLLTELSFPKVTSIINSAFGSTMQGPNTSLITLKLTASGKITLATGGNLVSSFGTEATNCTLYLNVNKKPGGTGIPTVEADGLTWFGVKWKAIKYVNDAGEVVG